MKVREMIAELSEHNPESEVFIQVNTEEYFLCPTSGIEIGYLYPVEDGDDEYHYQVYTDKDIEKYKATAQLIIT